jgi:hypothetical protein
MPLECKSLRKIRFLKVFGHSRVKFLAYHYWTYLKIVANFELHVASSKSHAISTLRGQMIAKNLEKTHFYVIFDPFWLLSPVKNNQHDMKMVANFELHVAASKSCAFASPYGQKQPKPRKNSFFRHFWPFLTTKSTMGPIQTPRIMLPIDSPL